MDPGDHDWLTLGLRLGLAAVAGGVIGVERHLAGKPAGLRTHVLVSVGAAVLVLTTAGQSADTSRVIQGIATGIGFLGAGEIVRPREAGPRRIKGLTSAAAVWVAAALGISAGTGLWKLTVVGGGLTLLVLTAAGALERRLPRRAHVEKRAEERGSDAG